MKYQRIKKILHLIGPYPYNPYLLFIIFFGFFFSRFVPLIVDLPAGRQRWEAGALIILVSLIPGIIFAGSALLLNRFRFWSSTSTFLYILEVATVQFIFMIYGIAVGPVIRDLLGYNYRTAIQISPNVFIASLIISLIALALMHKSERKIIDRLASANELVDQLKIDRAQLVEADEKVREQTSRFLHDRIQSDLMVVGMNLRTIAGKSSDEINRVIEQAIERLESTRSKDLRTLVEVLTPNFEVGGLTGSLEILCEQFRASMEISTDIDSASEELDTESLLGIYRIIEQSLLNSLVHGPAKRVQISVQTSTTGITELIVSDDGPGCVTEVSNPGVGTTIINSWIEILNGKKGINTSPDHGYLLMVVFPK